MDVRDGDVRVVTSKGSEAGGVLFLDEAYDLEPGSNADGKTILADIMNTAEAYRDKVTIILAGYKDDMEKRIMAFNIGMASRFETVHFDDFSTEELRSVCGWSWLGSSSGSVRTMWRPWLRAGWLVASVARALVMRAPCATCWSSRQRLPSCASWPSRRLAPRRRQRLS
jgi:hypothetical protein